MMKIPINNLTMRARCGFFVIHKTIGGAKKAPTSEPAIKPPAACQSILPELMWRVAPTIDIPTKTYDDVPEARAIGAPSSNKPVVIGPPPLRPAMPTIKPPIIP